MGARDVVDRVWPSAVALAGTVGVILLLLAVFGSDLDSAAPGATGSPTAASPSPSPTATTPPPEVKAPVLILNQTGVPRLAAQTAEVLVDQGWELAGLGNTSVAPPETTVYYPPGLQPAAETMERAFDGVDRVRPTVEGQRGDVLTLVLSSTRIPPTPAG